MNADEPGRTADYLGRSAKLVKETDENAAAERYISASKVCTYIDGRVTSNRDVKSGAFYPSTVSKRAEVK